MGHGVSPCKEVIPDWLVCVFGVPDAASVYSDIPGFAPSGDSLFFELRKEK
jgi:hypothetical protein